MQLPEFIRRALSFFDKAEANLNELSSVTAKVALLEGKLSETEKTLVLRDASILDLTGKLEASTEQTAKLTAEVDAEKKRANEVLAAQGIEASQVPAAEVAKVNQAKEETAYEKYQRMQQGSSWEAAREAARFYAENVDAIFASQPKK